jgi:hypothetical protein
MATPPATYGEQAVELPTAAPPLFPAPRRRQLGEYRSAIRIALVATWWLSELSGGEKRCPSYLLQLEAEVCALQVRRGAAAPDLEASEHVGQIPAARERAGDAIVGVGVAYSVIDELLQIK